MAFAPRKHLAVMFWAARDQSVLVAGGADAELGSWSALEMEDGLITREIRKCLASGLFCHVSLPMALHFFLTHPHIILHYIGQRCCFGL